MYEPVDSLSLIERKDDHDEFGVGQPLKSSSVSLVIVVASIRIEGEWNGAITSVACSAGDAEASIQGRWAEEAVCPA